MPGDDPDEAITDALIAKDRAAERGTTLVTHDPGQAQDAHRRRRQELDLPGAIARGELEVHYQPQVSLSDGAIVGVEALVRWQHPQMGFMRPDEFVAVAEAGGSIGELGAYVLERSCGDLRDVRGPDGPLKLSVNVSPQQFAQNDVGSLVRNVTERCDFPIDRLELEITESSSVTDAANLRSTLEPLRRQGLSVALDDFGTGYAQLGALDVLPIDKLKLDRSLVFALPGEKAVALVAAAMTIARGYGLTTVAEGIENERIAELLRLAGCHTGQGYHWSRPLPLEGLLALLSGKAAQTSA